MATVLTSPAITKPFKISISEDVLDDLQRRLKNTRWIKPVKNAGWNHGTSTEYLKEFVAYWQTTYDWREQERELNTFNHFTAMVENCNFHFIHRKGAGPEPMPLLLLHGWPDSFYRFHKIIPLLSDPESFGIVNTNLSFSVVVPSLPGFGFTQCNESLSRYQPLRHNAALLYKLMTDVLGYEHFAIAGGDGGSPLAQIMAIDYPESVTAIYLTDLGWNNSDVDPATLNAKEKHYLKESKQSFMKQSAYVMLQATKPQTLSYNLNDSPVGLASWILDRFYFWCDCNEDLEKSFSKDELLTNMMIYWVTGTIASSLRSYRMEAESPSLTAKDYVSVPVGLGLFPKDIGGIPPRAFAERTVNVQHWKEMPRGGHFAAWEEPELMASDLVEFFQQRNPVTSIKN